MTNGTVPSETLGGPYIGNENASIVLSGLSASATPNANDPLSVVLSVKDGVVSAGGQSGAAITLTGTAAQLNLLLASATYTSELNFYGSDTLSMATTDTADSAQVVANGGITVLDATVPTETVGSTYADIENTALTLSDLSVSAGPNSSDPLAVVLSVQHGMVSAGGQSSASLTLSGTAAQLDSLLASATYTDAPNYVGSDTLSMLTTDTLDNASVSAAGGINIGGGGPYLASEDAPIGLGGLTVSGGPNAGAGDVLSTVLSVSHGILSAGGQSGSSITLGGTAAQIDVALASATYSGAMSYLGPDTLSLATTDTANQNQTSATAQITDETGLQLAIQIIDAAPAQPFTLPTYTGSTTDLGYLKQWVLNQVTAIYGVSAQIFNTPTVLSTSILRDFVQRALYENNLPYNNDASVESSPSFLGLNDVALEFRYPIHGLCWDMAHQEFEVFRAFGFATDMLEDTNGPVDTYTDSHALTEVYVSDLGQYILQDATYNAVLQDTSGNILSFYQAVQANKAGTLVFNGTADYTYYNLTGVPETELLPSEQAYYKANYLKSVVWEWVDQTGATVDLISNLFLNYTTAHSPTGWQGGEFASSSAAAAAVASLAQQGQSWTAIAAALQTQGYYVSGFAFADNAGNQTTQWVTLRIATGDYVSVSLSGAVLNGSLDQLQDEASGGTVRNPGADLSSFLRPLYALGINGSVMDVGIPLTAVTGNASPSTLVAVAGVSSRLVGLSGDDVLDARNGVVDVLVGAPGTNTYYVNDPGSVILQTPGSGISTVYAYCNYTMPTNVQVMYLEGSATTATIPNGNGTIYGNNNNDIYYVQAGALAIIYGGTGSNTYYIYSANTTITQQIGGLNTVYAYCNYTMPTNVQIMNLKDAATTATISSGTGWIYGNNNNDIFYTQGALAHLYGGAGSNTYYLDNTSTTISQQAGGTNTIYAYCNYTMPANVQTMYLMGSATTATISSGVGTIFGNNNNDVYHTQGALAHLYGGTGSNTYYVDNPSTVISQQGGGSNTVYAYCNYTMPANVQTMYLMGAATTATISSGTGSIYGNNNNDFFYTIGALAHLYGGTGNNTYYINNPATTITQQVGGLNTVYAYSNYTMPANVQIMNLYGAATTATISTGTGWIYGNNNNDVFYTQGALAHLYGGTGSNTYYLDNPSTVISQQAGGNNTIYAYCNYTLPTNVQTMMLMGSATTATIKSGGTGTIYGNNNADFFYTFGAVAHLYGGTGNNTYYLDNPNTTITQQAGGIDTVYAYCNYTMPANVQILNLYGAATTATIGSGTGWIYGNNNNDTFYTQGALAHLFGGTGSNTYYLDNPSTRIVQQAGGTNTVDAYCSYTLPTNCQVLNLEGAANINGAGNGAADIITGNTGNNLLSGGGTGSQFTGGGGNDTFALSAGQANGDTIFDFNSVAGETDLLKLSGYGTAQQGANLTQVDPTHWRIKSASGLIRDTIALSNGYVLHAGDYSFS